MHKTNIGLISIYKIPLAISLTLAIAVTAMTTAAAPLVITMILTGAFFGTFLLDLEYVIYALIFEPDRDFSKTLLAFFKHGDFVNAARYIDFHRHEIKDKSLNSAIFQILLAFLAIYIVSSTTLLILKVFVLSVLANSMYKLAESYYENKLDDWFWAMKDPPSKEGLFIYSSLLIGIFVYCLYII